MELKEQFFEVLTALTKVYPSLKINRIGLRYVDQIEIAKEGTTRTSWASFWNKYIDSKLIQSLAFADDDKQIARQMNSIEMNYERFMLRFQYGIYNADYPAPNKKHSFIIDTDVYSAGLYDGDECNSLLDIFHEKASMWFEKSIKDALRKKMEVIE